MVKKAEVFVAGVLLLTITGCSSSTSGAKAPPLEVQVVSAEQKDVPIYREWIGTLDGFVNADIKAQVSGYLIQQAYKEGCFVQEGQLLFQIDPRPFQAALDQAQGQLAQAQGQLAQAQGATGAGRSAGRGGGGESAPHATGCGSLHSARAAAGHHTAGSGQRDAEQPGREGAGAGGAGAGGDRQGADHRRQRRGPVGEGRGAKPRRSTWDSRSSPRPSTVFRESRSSRWARW